jgi:hypothetical protein
MWEIADHGIGAMNIRFGPRFDTELTVLCV